MLGRTQNPKPLRKSIEWSFSGTTLWSDKVQSSGRLGALATLDWTRTYHLVVWAHLVH
jgi:hypothetical protein